MEIRFGHDLNQLYSPDIFENWIKVSDWFLTRVFCGIFFFLWDLLDSKNGESLLLFYLKIKNKISNW